MRRVCVVLAVAALLPVSARAEPIDLRIDSSRGGFSQTGTVLGDQTIDMGTVTMPGIDSEGTFQFSGLEVWENYTVEFNLEGLGSFNTLRAEILDPVDEDDRLDPAAQPDYVPAGYSTSNNMDGFSFAQGAAIERTVEFAGGQVSLTVDEMTHRGDVLLFSGLSGAESARVTFGLRDSDGGRSFLVRLSAADAVSTPEPASMLLIGTGLVGMAGAYRRRRRAASGAS